jgi:hypothetical protein
MLFNGGIKTFPQTSLLSTLYIYHEFYTLSSEIADKSFLSPQGLPGQHSGASQHYHSQQYVYHHNLIHRWKSYAA